MVPLRPRGRRGMPSLGNLVSEAGRDAPLSPARASSLSPGEEARAGLSGTHCGKVVRHADRRLRRPAPGRAGRHAPRRGPRRGVRRGRATSSRSSAARCATPSSAAPVNDLDFTTDARPRRDPRDRRPDRRGALGHRPRTSARSAPAIDGETVEITTYRSRRLRRRDPQARRRVRRHASRATSSAATSRSTRWRCACRRWCSSTRPAASTTSSPGGSRTPGTPEVSFGDDPLRMMRAARFTAQLGFDGRRAEPCARDGATRAAASSIISVERVSDELGKLLLHRRPARGHPSCSSTPASPTTCCPSSPPCGSRSTSTTTTRTSTSTASPCSTRPSSYEKARQPGEAPDLVAAARGAAARHRQAGHAAARAGRRRHLPPPRRRRVRSSRRSGCTALRFDNDTIAAVSRLIELHLRFFGYTDGRLDRLGRAPLRARRRRPARAAAHPDPGRRHDPQPPQGRPARLRLRRPRGRASPSSREQEEIDSLRPDLDGEQIMRDPRHRAGARGGRGVPLPARAAPRGGPARRRGRRAAAARLVGRPRRGPTGA